MTDEEIVEQIGQHLTGVITCDNADDARRIIDVLRKLGYRWQIIYPTTGAVAHITYVFDPK